MLEKVLPDILRITTSTVCVIVLFFALSRPKYRLRLYVAIATTIVIIDAIVCTVFAMEEKFTEEIFYSIPFYIIIVCAFKCLFQDNILQWMFNCVTVYIVYAIVFFSSYYLGNLFPLFNYGTMIFRVVLFAVFILFFYKFMRPLYLEVSESWGIFILPIIAIFATYVYLLLSHGDVYESMQFNVGNYCFLTVITLFVYTAIIGTIFSTKKKYAIKEENIKRKANEELLLNEITAYHEFVDIAKKNRHDLRHHNAVLAEYLATQDFDGALRYLNEYSTSIDTSALIDGSELIEFCENPSANAVLRVYEKRVRDLKIEFAFEAPALSKLPFSIVETSEVLSNILENAVEATAKSKSNHRFIHLISYIKENNLLVEVVNSIDCNKIIKNDLPISTKEDGGTGLKSVKDTVEKYGGIINFSQTGDTFSMRLIVPIKNNNA